MKSKETDRFLEERLMRYDKWLGAGEISYASKVIPVRESVRAKQWVMPSEQALEILRAANTIALTDCECRTHYKRCDNPLEVCFLLDDVAVKNMEEGRGRRASLEDAKDILRYANEKGLVHLSFYMPGNKIYAFCSCCYCCCHDLQLLRLYDRADLIARSKYIAVTDIKMCTDCGECIDRCLFGARVQEEERMHYNPKSCYGCGLCVNVCPEKATVLKQQTDFFYLIAPGFLQNRVLYWSFIMSDKKIDFDDRLQILCELYERKIPFNKALGLKIKSLKIEDVWVKFEMKEAFIGNYVQGILTGGVISAVLDITGGITASLGVIQKMAGRTAEEIGKSLAKIGTIDLRIDYLRPGKGIILLQQVPLCGPAEEFV